jgi:hypothetical protein
MKKLFLILAITLMAVTIHGQKLSSGIVLGLHTGTPAEFNEGYTMEKYMTFLKEKYIPAFEKNFPGIKLYILKGKRGECENCLGTLYLLESDEVRDKYFAPEGEFSDAGKAAFEKMNILNEEANKFLKGSDTPDKYTDWIVQ